MCICKNYYWIFQLFIKAPAFSNGASVGSLSPEIFFYASGLAASQKHEGILYTHNDGDDVNRRSPIIYAISATSGGLIARLRVFPATNEDWEDIAVGPCGNTTCIYVLDKSDSEWIPSTACKNLTSCTPIRFSPWIPQLSLCEYARNIILPPLTMKANYGWLIVYNFSSRMENIRVAILSGEWLQNFGLVIWSALIWPLSWEGSLSCHSCFGNMIFVCTISSEGPLHLGCLLRQTRVTEDLFQPELIRSSGWGDPRKKEKKKQLWTFLMQFFEWFSKLSPLIYVTFLLYLFMIWSVFILLCVSYTFVETAEQKPLMTDSEIQCIFLLVRFNVNCRNLIN